MNENKATNIILAGMFLWLIGIGIAGEFENKYNRLFCHLPGFSIAGAGHFIRWKIKKRKKSSEKEKET